MVGKSKAFRNIQALIDKIAACDAPVLIEGETGTGKEFAARAIHYKGARADRPFVPVNCGALPDQLIENELFGHRRGAFTDARDDQPGLVWLAHTGTLFLDEVDTLSSKGQITLLRFLQDHHFRPLGGRHEQKADVRIIAASNRILDQQVKLGEFRADLLYRLKLMHLQLPPLRERHGDIALLVEHFIELACTRFHKPAIPIDPATLAWFERYEWPGNIRELENLIYRSFLLADGGRLSVSAPSTIPAADEGPANPTGNYRHAKNQAITDFERRYLAHLIEQTDGNVSAAARISGTERRHLGRLLKKYGLSRLPSNEL